MDGFIKSAIFVQLSLKPEQKQTNKKKVKTHSCKNWPVLKLTKQT